MPGSNSFSLTKESNDPPNVSAAHYGGMVSVLHLCDQSGSLRD
ncbi:hypothetical protein [Desulfosporosinus fructosivorans]|nr:hypothetical protein [Desulfosporosinus fructosivorans]